MCEWGTHTMLRVRIPAHLSHTGEPYMKTVGVDACLAPIVKALNDAGIETSGSCCGHSEGPGSMLLLKLLPEPEKREPDADGLHWLTATMLVSKVLAAHRLGLSEDNEVALISDLVDAVCFGTPSDSPTESGDVAHASHDWSRRSYGESGDGGVACGACGVDIDDDEALEPCPNRASDSPAEPKRTDTFGHWLNEAIDKGDADEVHRCLRAVARQFPDSLIADPPHWTHIFVVDHDNGPYCGNCDVSPGDPTAADLCPASMETQTAAPEPEPDSEPTTGDLLADDDSVGEPAESEGEQRCPKRGSRPHCLPCAKVKGHSGSCYLWPEGSPLTEDIQDWHPDWAAPSPETVEDTTLLLTCIRDDLDRLEALLATRTSGDKSP